MLLLYHVVLLLLSGVRLVFTRRAARIERKFARLAKEVNGLLRDPVHKQGNSGREDPYQAAKRQYLLGALVQKKDRLEAKHFAWAQRADRRRDHFSGPVQTPPLHPVRRPYWSLPPGPLRQSVRGLLWALAAALPQGHWREAPSSGPATRDA